MREAEAGIASTRSQLTDWLGEEGDARTSFQVRESELTAAERALDEANVAMEAARVGWDGAKDAAAEAAVALVKIGGRLANAWGKLGEDRDVAADADSIRAAFLAVGEEVVLRHEAAASAGMDATAGWRRPSRNRAGCCATWTSTRGTTSPAP